MFELLVALAIFVGAAGVIVGTLHTTIANLERHRDEQAAADIARNKMSEIEAGLTSIEDVHDQLFDLRPSIIGTTGQGGGNRGSDVSTFDEDNLEPGRWRIEIHRERSRFEGLSLITLRVYDTQLSSVDSNDTFADNATCTLRQLIRIHTAGDLGEREIFQQDEVVDTRRGANGS